MSDESTMHTADDALSSKLSAIELKYFNDSYSKYFFNKKKVRKPPIINRGYYTRVECFKQAVSHFLEATVSCPQRQIIILGSGFDTLSFQLLLSEPGSGPPADNLLVAEVDFDPMVQRKLGVVLGNAELSARVEAGSKSDSSNTNTSTDTDTSGSGALKIPPSISEVEAEMEAAMNMSMNMPPPAPRPPVSVPVTVDMDMPPPAPRPPVSVPVTVGSGRTAQQQLDEAVRARQVSFDAPEGTALSPGPAFRIVCNEAANRSLYYVPHDLRGAAPKSVDDSDSEDENDGSGGGMSLGSKLKQLVARHCPAAAGGLTIDTPTLILTECVLVYMNRASTARLISSLTTPATAAAAATSASASAHACTFSNYVWCSYDMTNPQDAFGKMMVRNLTTLGPFALPGLLELPLLTDRAESFTGGTATTANSRSNTATAWVRDDGTDDSPSSGDGKLAVSMTMLTAYNKLVSQQEKMRIARYVILLA